MTIKKYSSYESNIEAFEHGKDYIIVYFKSGSNRVYTYTNVSCGASAVEQMIALGNAQSGLNSYISRHKPNYASKA